ncbi:nuclear transport factor 2 family protein [Sphingobacterium sp. N143]|uniref:nuclear transport factor 2 family protein n=1 Tax=Sphingobacterium sp. N143 TaxID=2746727 RepID=UPI002578C604|nr:nuclear transport factor 2 family protein [Sphingobacterium sp. N143]
MSTLFGKYFDKLKASKTKVADITGLKRQRISDLCNKDNSKPTPSEFYKIILTAILLKHLPEIEFNNAINEIFPNRPKENFLRELDNLSPEVRFILTHCLTQKQVEKDIKMSDGKISRLASEVVKDLEAIEFISFIEGLGENVLETFKRIYGSIKTIDILLPDASILNDRTNKVFQYISTYNNLDVDAMTMDFADDVVFLNIMNGEKTMELQGIEEFKKQAVEALSYFSERKQSIETMTHKYNSTEIVISYRAIAAIDFPNGLKKGDEIRLKGKSIFEFSADGKINRLTDIS